jgi:hypothetical protein
VRANYVQPLERRMTVNRSSFQIRGYACSRVY